MRQEPKQHCIRFRDNTTNYLSIFDGQKEEKVIVCLPALGVKAKYYNAFAEALNSQGNIIIVAEWRGLGKSSVRASRQVDFGYEDLILDVNEVITWVKQQYPNKKTFLLGHSLGGQISSLYTSRFSVNIEGVILIASGLVYYKNWSLFPKFKIWIAGNIFPPISRVFGYFPGHLIGFGGREGKTVMLDWAKNARTGLYKLLNTQFNYEKSLKQLKTSTLCLTMEGDSLAEPKAAKALYKKYSSHSEVTYKHFTRAETGISNLGHFNWAKHPQHFTPTIEKWLKQFDRIETSVTAAP